MAFNNNTTNPIKVIETPNKGRTLISTRPLTAGQTILQDSPLLLYSAIFSNKYCSHCFKPNPHSILSCPNCSSNTSFCSSKCQTTAFITSHTPFVCHSLTRLFSENSPLLVLNHDRQLQARFLVSSLNLALVDPSRFQSLLSLQGECIDDQEFVSFIYSMISSVCQVGSFGITVEMVSSLLAKDKVNAFGLMEAFDGTGERSVRAYGIYPLASFFNHDCLPNACRFDYVDVENCGGGNNTDIIVRVIHDLPEGREICLSYFPVNLKYRERQKRLKEDYGFVCDCDRCKVEANWSDDEEEGMDEGFVCDCDRCKVEANWSDDEEEGMDEGEAMEEEDEDMDEGNENGVEADLEIGDIGVGKENDDFPHAYFFMRYMCNKDNCWGTLAPLPPSGAGSSSVMECNVCGNLSKSED